MNHKHKYVAVITVCQLCSSKQKHSQFNMQQKHIDQQLFQCIVQATVLHSNTLSRPGSSYNIYAPKYILATS